MRLAEYIHSLKVLEQQHARANPDVRELSAGVLLDLSQPCVVLGGRNGAGKSRILRAIRDQEGVNGLLIDLHHLIEQTLMVLRSREDFDAMLEEHGLMTLPEETVSATNLIVGRQYDSIEWYSLEVEPHESAVAEQFKWGGDQFLIPYFKASYRNQDYTSLGMGLGEFSVHFLLWILEQYRAEESITLLLDEPDAYLPPIGVSALLYHLIDVCMRRKWKIVLSTHSEEMIRLARDCNYFTLLRVGSDGLTEVIHCSQDKKAGDSLLSPLGTRRLLFCEDESAWTLTNAILRTENIDHSRETSVVWGNGHGYLRELLPAMPKPPIPDIQIAYVFDGDQRGKVDSSDAKHWPAVFLPTKDDPDSLFKALADSPDDLAAALGVSPSQLSQHLDTMDGLDVHDWVNKLGSHFGRPHTLASLATLWCRMNPVGVQEFLDDLDQS